MMMKTMVAAAVATAAALGSSALISAQAPSPGTTLVGCVYEEKNVPGRAPDPAERVGVLEDYILAEITPAEASKPVGTSGVTTVPVTNSMYKLEHAKDEVLKSMVGKRVEVVGKIDAEAGDSTGRAAAGTSTSQADRVIGHDKIDLPEFEVVSIRAIAGACPAKPSVGR